nr:potassium transporter TrkA [uncultured Campylobacter sp.]
MNFKLIAVYGAFEALLLLGSAVFGRAWLYSSQVAFAGSLLVLAATFKAYKKRVENGVRDYDVSADDDIDEWGENHEEFPDSPAEAKFDEQNLNDAGQIGQLNLSRANESNLNESNQNSETKPSKKQNFAHNLKQNSPNYFTAFVPFRLIAYAVLVVGFLALKRQGNLDIAAFLIALAAMPAGALIYGVRSNEK